MEAEFVAPEGVSAEETARLRDEAVRIAMLDPSKEAMLARKYEAAAERAFFRCLKDLERRQRAEQAAAKADDASLDREMMASFSDWLKTDAATDAMARFGTPPSSWPGGSPLLPPIGARVNVPITVGRPR